MDQDNPATDVVIAAKNEVAQARMIFGDGGQFEPDRVAGLIAAETRKHIESGVRMGDYLNWALAELGHGEYIKWYEQNYEAGVFGVKLRMAHNYRAASLAAKQLQLKKLDGWSIRSLVAAQHASEKETEALLGERLPAPGKDRSPYDGMTADQLREELRIRDRKLQRGEEQLNTAHAKIRELEARYPNQPLLAAAKQLEVQVSRLRSLPCPDEVRTDAAMLILAPIYEQLDRYRRFLQGDADPE